MSDDPLVLLLYVSFLVLSRPRISQLSQEGVSLCLPFLLLERMNRFYMNRKMFLKNSQNSLATLFFKESSHEIPSSWALSELKFAVLKSQSFVLDLTCSSISQNPQYHEHCRQTCHQSKCYEPCFLGYWAASLEVPISGWHI